MNVFVLVALAVLLLSGGAVVVAALALRRAAQQLRAATEQAGARLAPLAEELAAEQAVSALELDALQRGIAVRRASRKPGG